MNQVCRLVWQGVGEGSNLSSQHVDSAHRPLPPPPALPRVTAKGREPDCVKGDDTNPPPRTPVMALRLWPR